jgi:hypothetical protein
MPLREHLAGNYRFLPGIAPYSCGVVSTPGFEIVHATLERPVPYNTGFALIERHLVGEHRPREALCGVELRSPRPFTFEGFDEFNTDYGLLLENWGLFVDGINPVPRTNVAPEIDPPAEPILHAFSYTRPCERGSAPTFVVAGAGELPEGVLAPEFIVAAGDTSPEGIAVKARFVLKLMENRLHGLGVDWPRVTAIHVYTVHPLDNLLPEVVQRAGRAARHGIRWFLSRPPVQGIEFEIDLRGVRSEVWIG